MTMDKQLHISAKDKTDLLPNEGVFHAASAGGVGFTSQDSRITVGIVNRAARYKIPCVKGGTYSKKEERKGRLPGLVPEPDDSDHTQPSGECRGRSY